MRISTVTSAAITFVLGSCTADGGGATGGETSGATAATTSGGTPSAGDASGPDGSGADTTTPSTTDGPPPGSDTSDDSDDSSGDPTGPGGCVPASALAADCRDDWAADGECDARNNSGDCDYDGGDCCASTCVGGDFACGIYGFDCRDPGEGGFGDAPPELVGDPCAERPDPFDMEALRAEVELLSTDELAGRRPGFRGDATTRAYLEARFECLELTPLAEGCYAQPFANDSGDPTGNVIGLIPGADPEVAHEIIVIGGHHDHLGEEGGEVYNGANDNVSGIVALLAIAQAIQDADVEPRRTIAFVAFGSEESGLEGASYFVNNPPPEVPLDDVVYMINLDMLGTYDVVGEVDAFGTFEDTPGRMALDALLEDQPDLNVHRGIASPEGDSDYDPFCAEDIPYVYFETFDPPCWHEACDDPGRMDYPHLATLAKLKHDILVELATTTTDLAAARETFGCARGPTNGRASHHLHP